MAILDMEMPYLAHIVVTFSILISLIQGYFKYFCLQHLILKNFRMARKKRKEF